jgi:hypothetical protein
MYKGVSKIFPTDAVKIINLTTKRVWKLRTSTQLRATWHTDSLDMVVLPSIGASRYHNCYIAGGTSPEYFGYTLVQVFLGMNTWMFETCLRQYNGIKSLMEKGCILLVLITRTYMYHNARFKKCSNSKSHINWPKIESDLRRSDTGVYLPEPWCSHKMTSKKKHLLVQSWFQGRFIDWLGYVARYSDDELGRTWKALLWLVLRCVGWIESNC